MSEIIKEKSIKDLEIEKDNLQKEYNGLKLKKDNIEKLKAIKEAEDLKIKQLKEDIKDLKESIKKLKLELKIESEE